MANPLKYSTSNPVDALQLGTLTIGNHSGQYATTWYSGITPSDYYMVYYANTGGHPIFYAPNSLAELKQLAVGKGMNPSLDPLEWMPTQGYYPCNRPFDNIITDNLKWVIDSTNTVSYPTVGKVWYNLSGETSNMNMKVHNSTFLNKGLEFNGTSTKASASLSNINVDQNDTALEVLFKPMDLSRLQAIFTDNWGPEYGLWIQYKNGSYKLAGRAYENGVFSPVEIGKWYHVVFNIEPELSGSSSPTLSNMYVNGEFIGSNSSPTGNGLTDRPFTLGADHYGGVPQSFFSGSIASSKIYYGQHNQSEVNQNYYRAPIVTDGLVFAVDAGNLVSYEGGSLTTYSLTGSFEGTLNNGLDIGDFGPTAWDFGGTDDYIALPDDIGYTTAVSTFAWYKSNGTPGNGYHIICGDSGLEISIPQDTGELRTGINTSVQRYVDNYGSTDLVDGEWHYIGFTFSDTTKTSYIDGVSVGTQTTTGTLISNVSPRALGKYPTTYFANGNMGLYTVYNREITAEEVLQNYNANYTKFK